MRRKSILILALAVPAFALAGCGGGSGGATCSPNGDDLRIEAKNLRFDTDCLAAPADQPFTITFDNEDGGTPHNVDIVSESGDELFGGDLFDGVDQKVYLVHAFHPGTYRFRCEVHPATMEGTFIVK